MKSEIERRKDPALRYLWGMIFDLEEKIKSYEEKQEVFNKELGEIKKKGDHQASHIHH